MILFILIIAVILITAFYSYDFFEAFIAFIVSSLIALFVYAGVGVSMLDSGEVKYDEVSLAAIGNSSETNSSIFLGMGVIEGKQVINYIQKNDDGSSQLKEMRADEAYIYEDSEKAYLKTSTKTVKKWWFSPIEFNLKDRTEFHVPEGTIDKTFEINVSPTD